MTKPVLPDAHQTITVHHARFFFQNQDESEKKDKLDELGGCSQIELFELNTTAIVFLKNLGNFTISLKDYVHFPESISNIYSQFCFTKYYRYLDSPPHPDACSKMSNKLKKYP